MHRPPAHATLHSHPLNNSSATCTARILLGCWHATLLLYYCRELSPPDVPGAPTSPWHVLACVDTRTVCIPEVHHVGELAGARGAFIVMDYLRLGGAVDQAVTW